LIYPDQNAGHFADIVLLFYQLAGIHTHSFTIILIGNAALDRLEKLVPRIGYQNIHSILVGDTLGAK
jgi:hypothetical protein